MIWRTIPTAGLYEVSSTGQLRRAINRSSGHRHRQRPWVYIKPEIDRDGYLRVSFTENTGQRRKLLVHRLVYWVFCGGLQTSCVVCHKDGNRLNNRPENLLQTTQKVNISHKKRHGTHQAGENHPCARHTQAEVDFVRLVDGGAYRTPAWQVAELCDVSVSLVNSLRQRARRTGWEPAR